jgi:hypothetical protein
MAADLDTALPTGRPRVRRRTVFCQLPFLVETRISETDPRRAPPPQQQQEEELGDCRRGVGWLGSLPCLARLFHFILFQAMTQNHLGLVWAYGLLQEEGVGAQHPAGQGMVSNCIYIIIYKSDTLVAGLNLIT